MKATYTCSSGQTVFDVALNIYTDLDNVINLLQLSNIDNVNEDNLNGKVVNYDTDLISDFIVYKYIFSKKKRFNTGKIITESEIINLLGSNSSEFIVTELGYKIKLNL